MPDLLTDGSSTAVQFLFAHGAGAPMDSPFMNAMAAAIAFMNGESIGAPAPCAKMNWTAVDDPSVRRSSIC